jgi:DNA-binding response OmpR family regulator
MFKADCHSAALPVLRQHDISVVLCERELKSGKWTELLDHIKDLSHPPSLIVTSRLADERLWAEALNLGAWDVLTKPFDRMEVLRSVKAGWQHWYDQIQMPVRMMKAAS